MLYVLFIGASLSTTRPLAAYSALTLSYTALRSVIGSAFSTASSIVPVYSG